MSDVVKSVKQGLTEALAHAQGKETGAVVHEIAVDDPNVTAIREKTGLSQPEFAASISVSLGTLRGWEQGRRRPTGPARVLLALIDKRPTIVRDELAA